MERVIKQKFIKIWNKVKANTWFLLQSLQNILKFISLYLHILNINHPIFYVMVNYVVCLTLLSNVEVLVWTDV